MKKFFLIAFIIAAFAFKASAQTSEKFSIDDFKKYVGKKVTLCDTVYSYKIFSDTLTMINMGGKYPNQKFTIVVTGKEVQLNYDTLTGKHVCVTGDLSLYKDRPEVLIYHTNQIEFK